MNKKYTQEELFSLLDDCVPCNVCGGQSKLFLDCNFVRFIFCENAKRAEYPIMQGTCENKSYDTNGMECKDIHEHISNLVNIWNKENKG